MHNQNVFSEGDEIPPTVRHIDDHNVNQRESKWGPNILVLGNASNSIVPLNNNTLNCSLKNGDASPL